MKLKTKDIFPLLIFGFVAVLMILAIDYPWEAKLLPLIIGAIVVILIILQLLIEKNKRMYNHLGFLVVKEEESNKPSESESNEDKEDKKEDQLVSRKELTIFLWIIFLGAAVYFLHYIVGVFCFLFLILKFLSKLSWTKTILVSVIVTGCLYLLFSVLLNIAV